jgi:hypothetical protein
MKHAIDRGNREEQKSQPVKDFELFKLFAPPPRYQKHNCNVGTWKSCAWIFSLCPNKIHYCAKQAVLKIIFISQLGRALNGQKYEYDVTHVEQGGKLEYKTLEKFYIFAVEQNEGQRNYQIITKIKKVKKLVKESITMCTAEKKTGKLAEDTHVKIKKKAIQKFWCYNRVDQSGLIVNKTVQDQGIPQAQSAKISSYRCVSENLACASPYFSQTAPPAKA